MMIRRENEWEKKVKNLDLQMFQLTRTTIKANKDLLDKKNNEIPNLGKPVVP